MSPIAKKKILKSNLEFYAGKIGHCLVYQQRNCLRCRQEMRRFHSSRLDSWSASNVSWITCQSLRQSHLNHFVKLRRISTKLLKHFSRDRKRRICHIKHAHVSKPQMSFAWISVPWMCYTLHSSLFPYVVHIAVTIIIGRCIHSSLCGGRDNWNSEEDAFQHMRRKSTWWMRCIWPDETKLNAHTIIVNCAQIKQNKFDAEIVKQQTPRGISICNASGSFQSVAHRSTNPRHTYTRQNNAAQI